MSYTSIRLLRAAAPLLALVMTVAGALPAAAGCLREYGQCGDCAKKAMRDAIWDLDLEGALDAYVDAADCDIDLFHCIVLGQHHSYECGI